MNEKSISFSTISEDFSRYKLEDNIILKTKISLNRIIDTGQTDQDGNAKLEFDGQTQTLIEGDIETHEPSSNIQVTENDVVKDNIKFEIIEEKIQVYHIPKYKQIVLMIAIPVRIGLTSKYDKFGYPIYYLSTKNKFMVVKFPAD